MTMPELPVRVTVVFLLSRMALQGAAVDSWLNAS